MEYYIQTLPQTDILPKNERLEITRQQKALQEFFLHNIEEVNLENLLFTCAKEHITRESLPQHGEKILELIEKDLVRMNYASIKKLFDLDYPGEKTRQDILALHIIKNRPSLSMIQEMEQVFGPIDIPPSYRTFIERY